MRCASYQTEMAKSAQERESEHKTNIFLKWWGFEKTRKVKTDNAAQVIEKPLCFDDHFLDGASVWEPRNPVDYPVTLSGL